jgi:hypothetical protein
LKRFKDFVVVVFFFFFSSSFLLRDKMNRILARSESHFMGLSVQQQQELEPLMSSDAEQAFSETEVSVDPVAVVAPPTQSWLRVFVSKLQASESSERHYWLLGQLVVIAFVAFVWPIELCFPRIWPYFPYFVAVDSIADILFVSDTVLTALSRRSAVVSDFWFWLDIFSVLPADIFVWNPLWLHFALRGNRLLRLVHVRAFVFEFQRYSIKSTAVLFLSLALALLFIANAFSCVYVGISFVQNFSTPWG